MIRKQILRAQKHSRKDLLEREKTEISEPKLTFNISYYQIFQNRSILQELHLSLAPDKGHKKVFLYVTVVGFRNGKSLKDDLVRAPLPATNEIGRCEACGKKTCSVCNSIRTTTTFTMEADRETFQIQSGTLNFNLEKYYIFGIVKCVVRLIMLEKLKLRFDIGLITIKANMEVSGKETEKYPRNSFTIMTVWMVI